MNKAHDHILFLAASNASTRMDINMLRQAGGLQANICNSADNAMDFLTKHPVSMIVCHETIGTMPVIQFFLQMRRQSALQHIPTLVLSGCTNNAKKLQELGISCLLRPFTPANLAQAMLSASDISCLSLPQAQRALPNPARASQQKKADDTPSTPTGLLDKGTSLQSAGDPNGASQCFLAVLDKQPDNPQAHLALAEIYKRTGQSPKWETHLLRAAAGLLRRGQHEQANFASRQLPIHMRGGNIFAYEALFYLDSMNYRQAAHSFLEAAATEPTKGLHEIISRVCQFTDNPEECLHNTCLAFERMGKASLAATLRHRLLHNFTTGDSPQNNWLDKFPTLRDALSIATYTASAWRQAG